MYRVPGCPLYLQPGYEHEVEEAEGEGEEAHHHQADAGPAQQLPLSQH